MAERYSKSTVAVKVWCRRCMKDTMHNVHDGQRGGCQECIARLDSKAKETPAPPAATQDSLF